MYLTQIIMPNLDGTGPKGEGKLTGRKCGKCAGATPCPKGKNLGRGCGGGKGRGMGRGVGLNSSQEN